MPADRSPSRLLLGAIAAFLALGAIPVGLAFVARPDGSLVGMPVAVLAGTPFRDFTVPGLVLALAVGGSTLAASVLVVRGSPGARRAALAAGVVVMGWIVVQVALIGALSALQPVVGALGLAMVLLARRRRAPGG